MNVHMNLKNRCAVALLLTACASLAACDDAVSMAAPRIELPPLYVDVIEVRLDDGQNVVQKNYLDFLKACQVAGAPIKPLTKSEVALAGTTRYQRWFDVDLEVRRREHWNWITQAGAPLNTCFFELVYKGDRTVITPAQVTSTDLATGEIDTEPFPPEQSFVPPAYVPEPDLVASWRAHGFEGPFNTRVAGQPCTQWVTPLGEKICLWSGGWQRGISDAPIPMACAPGPEIVLSSEPDDGSGCRVTTQSITVGEPLDPDAYQSARSR